MLSWYDFARMDRTNAGIAGEIGDVQRQDMRDAVYSHSCSQSGVVYLDAHDRMIRDDPAPFAIDGFVVRQQMHASLDHAHFAIRFVYSQAESVLRSWPSHRVP